MATILTKKKDTTGAPSAGDLTNSSGGAELAVNTADKRLYTKDSGGNVVEVGINPTSITTGTLNTSGAVVFNDAGADVDFRVEGDTNANLLFVDASTDRVGIGTSSPGAGLEVKAASGSAEMRVTTSGGLGGRLTASAGDGSFQVFNKDNYALTFGTDNTERMRITSGGYFKASNTGSYNDASGAYHELIQSADSATVVIRGTNASQTNTVVFVSSDRNTTDNTYYAFGYYNYGASAWKLRVADSGNVTNTNNSYGAISDVKLKQDIVDAGSQWNDIKGLRVRKFRWKSDPDGFMQMGLVAQEAEEVSPGLIDEHPDYEEVEVPVLDDEGNAVLNEDGTPQVTKERNALGTTTKAVKYSVLYMKAVKALQEAMERIEALEAKVAALENS